MTWVTLPTLEVAAEPLKARAPSVKSNEKIVVKTQRLEGLGEGFSIKTDKWTWAYVHPIPSKSTHTLHQAKNNGALRPPTSTPANSIPSIARGMMQITLPFYRCMGPDSINGGRAESSHYFIGIRGHNMRSTFAQQSKTPTPSLPTNHHKSSKQPTPIDDTHSGQRDV